MGAILKVYIQRRERSPSEITISEYERMMLTDCLMLKRVLDLEKLVKLQEKTAQSIKEMKG